MDLSSRLPLALPRRTVRLFGEYWVPLVAWYLIGRGLHDLLAELGARVNFYSPLAGYSLLALAILCSLASYVVMFLSVQRGLPTIWRLRGSEKRTAPELLGAVGLTLMPFLLIYSGWNLFEEDLYQLQYRTWQFHPFGDAPDPAEFTLSFAIGGAIAWVLVKICEAITRRTANPVSGVLAAVFEANWMFFGIFGVMALWGIVGEWAQGTVAWQNLAGLKDFMQDVVPVLPIWVSDGVNVLTADFGWLSGYSLALKNGIALPLAWLAIAGACYGREMEDARGIVSERQLARFDARWQQAPTVVQRWARRFPPAGFREKYYPPLHAIRLILTAGLPGALLFCLFYSVLDLGQNLLTQGIVTIIGPHSSTAFWSARDSLVDQAAALLIQPLKICLLAVTFDLALERFSSRTAGTGDAPRSTTASDEAPVPAP